jgi:hypothetical protein
VLGNMLTYPSITIDKKTEGKKDTKEITITITLYYYYTLILLGIYYYIMIILLFLFY